MESTPVKDNHLRFSAFRYFDSADAKTRAKRIRQFGEFIDTHHGPMALLGEGAMGGQLLDLVPSLKSKIPYVLSESDSHGREPGLVGLPGDMVLADLKAVLITETRAYEVRRLARLVPERVTVITAASWASQCLDTLPDDAFIPVIESIYPIDIPDIAVSSGLDMLLLDCPARNMSLMPNGLAYVNNILEKEAIGFETLDLDIIAYHRFHMHRIMDNPERIPLPNEKWLPEDPWIIEDDWVWKKMEHLDFIKPDILKAVHEIVRAKPSILGVSVHENNALLTGYLVREVKKLYPDIMVVAGGYSCLDPTIGLKAFPEAHYMVIGEAEEVLGPLVRGLLDGQRPSNLPGIMSVYDKPGQPFVPGPLPMNLDGIEPPRYPWCDLSLYRNWNGYALTPIVTSRGCRWSRCRFCTERFYWRNRSASLVVDELEWLYHKGKDLFMINDSDFNGDQENLKDICREIIKRRLTVKLTGQLRIDPDNTPELFSLMREAGFVAVRFGVDAWSENTLKISRKGYSVKTIRENLKACKEAEIYTEINLVVGYPGETDDDIDETLRNIQSNKEFIGRFAVVNPLMLKAGSEFWKESEKFSIFFRQNKEELYKVHPNGIPSRLWFSEKPYIDEKVRASRVAKIATMIDRAGIDLGGVAAKRIKDMEDGDDVMRGEISEKTNG